MPNASFTLSIPPELLQEIFLKNTEVDDLSHDRLRTARYSSQVCQSWRSLLLRSPFVWARLLDLDSLGRSREKWSEEVVSRIGDAPIWMEGRVRPSLDSVLMFVLEKKWENVQALRLVGSFNHYPTNSWSFIGRKAPLLETLTIHFPDSLFPTSQLHSLCSSLLFNNEAPRLRELEISTAFQVKPSAPWLSNLQVLILSTKQTVTSILSILHNTPRLERLHLLPKSILAAEEISTSPVQLPHLQFLHIGYTDYSEAVPFLELISPSCTTCLLSMERAYWTFNVHGVPLIDPMAEKLHRAVLRWILTYSTGFGIPNDITLETYSSELAIFLWIRGPKSEAERRHYLRTTINVDIPLGPNASFIQSLIDASPSPFSSVKKLRLTSFINHRDELLQLLQTFSSVTELVLDPGWEKISALCPTQSQFFPQLRIVEVRPTREGPQYWTMAASRLPNICDFLEHRAAVGLPVSELDLRDVASYLQRDAYERLLDRLNKIDGLVVKWGSLYFQI
ncbi:hypothetical protein CPC08DRAFT_714719 [Agrocybe pediades]|nr:hypothetical protein CPC08DRAFT_714719 [Agrocybe pediades]